MSLNAIYDPCKKEIWAGRVDHPVSNSSLRVHQVIKFLGFDIISELENISPGDLVLIGYSIDEGIRLNKGRTGAKNGPDHIRNSLSSLPYSNIRHNIFDAGNVVWKQGSISFSQGLLAEAIKTILINSGRPIVLGGGHDVALGHFSGIKKALPEHSRIGIINFDAHFDLRTGDKENGNSGTPFYQIKELQKQNFLYLPIGIRKSGNTLDLELKAKEWCKDIIYLDELYAMDPNSVLERINDFMGNCDCIYLSVDLDGFSQSIAPGVSAPNPTGMSWALFYPLFNLILASKKVISMDVAECNPDYDIDNMTAKLASEILWKYIHLNIMEKI